MLPHSGICPVQGIHYKYGSIFKVDSDDRLLTHYEAEDAYIGRLFDVGYAEAFKSHSPLLVVSPTVFLPGLHG